MSNYFFEKKRRPPLIVILCLLTIINNSLSLIVGISNAIYGPSKSDAALPYKIPSDANQDLVEIIEQLGDFLVAINEHFYFFNTVSILLATLGIIAAQKMFNGHKLGFHLYIIFSIASIAQYYLLIPVENISTFYIITNLIFSCIYIMLYSKNLNWMNQKETN